MTCKLRFAPSPTGELHVGNARTALVNFLFAKSNNGILLLRIDDTDKERSEKKFEESIKNDLLWLGIKWDMMDRQSNRFENYTNAIKILEENGRAYRCYETPEELSLRRKSQLMSGRPPVYDRQALNLTEKDHLKFEKMGKKAHWRFKLIHEDVTWNDMIRGECNYNMSSLSDPVIMREDGKPIYTLASVIDDIDHKITHIIRGEDHVTNSAAQIQLFDALGAKPPKLGHLSLLSGSEGEGLSKRIGSLSLGSIKEKNIENISLVSMLSSIGTSQSITHFGNIDSIIEKFDINNFSRNTAKFDINELFQINQKVLQNYDFSEVERKLNIMDDNVSEVFWDNVKGNLDTFPEIETWVKVVYGEIIPIIEDERLMNFALNSLPKNIDELTWREWTKAITDASGIKGKELYLSLRKALTGLASGPELANLLPIIGKQKIISRLNGEKS
mgnify:FL=1|tara:strand:- start:161 stop:1495 length:1335 start_codon:yes stop_codon:yes gene_type:complete